MQKYDLKNPRSNKTLTRSPNFRRCILQREDFKAINLSGKQEVKWENLIFGKYLKYKAFVDIFAESFTQPNFALNVGFSSLKTICLVSTSKQWIYRKRLMTFLP